MAKTTTTAKGATVAATELAPGTSLSSNGRYRLQRLLGTGGMASVWLADDTRLARTVAIKLLADSLALDAEYVARFEREARVAAGLSHPNLVRVFDVSTDPPRPYLVMEHVAGGTLADRLRTPDAGGWDTEVMIRQLLNALAYVHRAGIVHRDIKPANVLIDRDGRVRLTDFGVARPSAASQLTSTGVVVGTARYMAPELLKGRRATERSDLFSCGVLLGDCLRERGGPWRLNVLADHLTAVRPELRPASAGRALALLEGARVAPRAPRPPASAPLEHRLPRISREGRELRVQLPRWTVGAVAVGVAALAVVLIAIALLTGGGSRPQRAASSRPVAPPRASAPLDRQLDYLRLEIGRARR